MPKEKIYVLTRVSSLVTLFDIQEQLSLDESIDCHTQASDTLLALLALQTYIYNSIIIDLQITNDGNYPAMDEICLLTHSFPWIPVIAVIENTDLSKVLTLLSLGVQCIVSRNDLRVSILYAVRAARNHQRYFSQSILKIIGYHSYRPPLPCKPFMQPPPRQQTGRLPAS